MKNKISPSGFLKKLEITLEGDRPFAVYSKPGSGRVGLLEAREEWPMPEDGLASPGYVIQPFLPEQTGTVLVGDFFEAAELPEGFALTVSRPEFCPDGSGKAEFLARVEKALKAIRDTDLEKVVISRPIEIPGSHSPLALFRRLHPAFPHAYRFVFRSPAWGLWMGATPELFCRKHGLAVETYSLAGTYARSSGNEPVWTSKEFEEQDKVTDYVRDRLKSLGLPVEVGSRETLAAGPLWHLLSRISTRVNSKAEIGALIRALHPTSAVSGMPREEALDFLDTVEGYNRELYAGFHGEWGLESKGDMELFVNLRCMKITAEQATLYVGAGITSGSQPEAEFYETEAKSTVMGSLFPG